MKRNLTFSCKDHHDEFDCPDSLIRYIPKFDEYGIIIRDGGTSTIGIFFCPWCGIKLPESKRDLWFDTLEELGFDDPSEQAIPVQYESSEWYKEKHEKN